MRTTVANIRTGKYDVYIGRAGKGKSGYFGSPFRLEAFETRQDCLLEYEEWFYARIKSDPEFYRRVKALRGKVLGCFCAPLSCHGDVIAKWLNGEPRYLEGFKRYRARRLLMKLRWAA